MSNPFFDFLKYWPKPFRKKLEYKYEPSYLKSAFRIIFWIWEVVKLNICKYVYLHIFQFEHRLKSKINSKSRFEIRMWIILYWFFLKLALTLYFVTIDQVLHKFYIILWHFLHMSLRKIFNQTILCAAKTQLLESMLPSLQDKILFMRSASLVSWI